MPDPISVDELISDYATELYVPKESLTNAHENSGSKKSNEWLLKRLECLREILKYYEAEGRTLEEKSKLLRMYRWIISKINHGEEFTTNWEETKVGKDDHQNKIHEHMEKILEYSKSIKESQSLDKCMNPRFLLRTLLNLAEDSSPSVSSQRLFDSENSKVLEALKKEDQKEVTEEISTSVVSPKEFKVFLINRSIAGRMAHVLRQLWSGHLAVGTPLEKLYKKVDSKTKLDKVVRILFEKEKAYQLEYINAVIVKLKKEETAYKNEVADLDGKIDKLIKEKTNIAGEIQAASKEVPEPMRKIAILKEKFLKKDIECAAELPGLRKRREAIQSRLLKNTHNHLEACKKWQETITDWQSDPIYCSMFSTKWSKVYYMNTSVPNDIYRQILHFIISPLLLMKVEAVAQKESVVVATGGAAPAAASGGAVPVVASGGAAVSVFRRGDAETHGVEYSSINKGS